MRLTTNLGLKKPEGTDVVNIDDFNYNADILDAKVKEISNKLSSISTNAKNTSFDNSSNGMAATNVQDAIVENKTSILSLDLEMQNIKQYVGNGKELIASAITDKNVPTSNTDSFEVMANNIRKIDTNIPPTITDIFVSNVTLNGFTLSYSATDKDSHTILTHRLKIENGDWIDIAPNKNVDKYTYKYAGKLIQDTMYNCYIEVFDGKSRTESQFSFTSPNLIIYGIDIDETNSNPSTCVTYTDNAIGFNPLFCGNGNLDYGSWEDTFVIQGNKPCVLKDGVVQYYLNPNDYSKKENGEDSDITRGNDGDVMAEFKKCYYKLWKEGDIVKFRVADGKPDDSWCCNAFLSEDGEGEEKDYMYISTYESYSLSSKMKSLSGKVPWVSHTISTARTQATSNGSGYQQLTLSKYTFVAMLTALVTKSLDHQTKIGKGNSSSSSKINTGTMNTKGQFWGDQTGKNGMKVFHIENFYGNVWTFIDGLIVSSRVSKYKVTGPYNDSGSDYISGYNISSTNGYISKINCSNGNGMIPSTSGGSATTYYTDYVLQNAGTYISNISGYWDSGSSAGSFCLNTTYASSYSNSALGSRLSFS